MDIKNTVTSLCEVSGASGNEDAAAELALDMLRKYCPDAHIESGNVIGKYGTHSSGKPLLVLDAHIDQVGFIVTSITDQGFVKFSSIGGIDRRLLPAQPVVIHGIKDVRGVICSVPPHLSKGDSKVLSFDEAAIDTGFPADELKKLVQPGDTITYDVKHRTLLGSRITAPSLDDRCGVAAILRSLELLEGSECAYNVVVIFSTQEEVGERGAAIGAYALDADVALAVDVSFGWAASEDEKNCGYIGKGAMIGISPSLSRQVSRKLIAVAENCGLPYQTEVMSGLTSTNADRYSVARSGAKTGTVSIPLRNMHTPVEVIDLEDVENTARLLAGFMKENLQ